MGVAVKSQTKQNRAKKLTTNQPHREAEEEDIAAVDESLEQDEDATTEGTLVTVMDYDSNENYENAIQDSKTEDVDEIEATTEITESEDNDQVTEGKKRGVKFAYIKYS